MESQAIYLITGPMAAGKTTVARLLAQRFQRGVHLEGDLFRRSILAGRAEMTPNPSPEALAQLRLRYRLAAQAADMYARAGFTVVWDDVVAGPLLDEVVSLVKSRPLHLIVLLPGPATIASRGGARYTSWTVDELHRAFAAETPRAGLWLDTSDQSPEEKVDEILARPAGAIWR